MVVTQLTFCYTHTHARTNEKKTNKQSFYFSGRNNLNFSIMKSNGLLGEKLPFYQKVLNMTLGIGSDKSPATRKAEEPLASPFRRGYTRPGRPGLPVTPIVVTTPGHPAHIGTPVTGTGSATKHGSASSTAASIFRSFRRRSLRRSFRRTKSFLVKNSTTTTTTPTVTGNAINRPVNKRVMR